MGFLQNKMFTFIYHSYEWSAQMNNHTAEPIYRPLIILNHMHKK